MTDQKHRAARGKKRRFSSESPERPRDLRNNVVQSLQFDGCNARARDVSMEYHGTCEWLLKSDIWKRWYQPSARQASPENRLLCMRGKPGVGKSTLMKFALEHVQKIAEGRNHIVVFHFFNARGSKLEKSVPGLYRSLLCQLLKRLSIADVESLPMPANIGTESQWTINELANLLRAVILQLHQRNSAVVCFVDALDECEGDVNGMLTVFQNLMALTPRLRVCYACRHYPDLPIDENRINSFALEEQNGHHDDLRTYVDSHFTIDLLRNPQVRSDVLDKVNGIFLYCVLVVTLVSDECRAGRINTRQDVQRLLNELPDDLQALFQDILTRQSLSTRGRQEMMLCLQWVLFFLRDEDHGIRLTPVFLWWAVQRGMQERALSREGLQLLSVDVAKRYILNISRGLLEVTASGQVQVIHESVREFFCQDSGLLALTTQAQPHIAEARDVIALSHKRLQEICWDAVFSDSGTQDWLNTGSEKHFKVYAVYSLLRHAEAAEEQQSQHVSQVVILQELREDARRALLCQRYNLTRTTFRWTRGSSRPLSMPEQSNLQTILCWQGLPELLSGLYCLEKEIGKGARFGLSSCPSQAIQYHQTFDDLLDVDWARVEWPWATPIESAIRMNNWATLIMLANIQFDWMLAGSFVSPSKREFLESLAKTIDTDIRGMAASHEEAFRQVVDVANIPTDDIFAASPVILLEEAASTSGSCLSILFLVANLAQDLGDIDQMVGDWTRMPTNSLCEAMTFLLSCGVCPFGTETWVHDKTDMLIWAISKHHDNIASCLIAVYGVQDCHDRFGRTPLHMAAQWGNDTILAQLLPLYEEEPRDRIGETPLMKAASRGHHGSFKILREWPLTRIGRRNHDGESILHHAVEGGDSEMLKSILDSNIVDASLLDSEGCTFLHRAAKSGTEGLLTSGMLIDAGVAQTVVNIRNSGGETALDIACHFGNMMFGRALREVGAVSGLGVALPGAGGGGIWELALAADTDVVDVERELNAM